MKELTQVEKDLIAILMRQELNASIKDLEEFKGNIKEEYEANFYKVAKSGYRRTKEAYQEIANKLGFEL